MPDRSRRVAVDDTTFENTGIEWNTRAYFVDDGSFDESTLPENFNDNFGDDYTSVDLSFDLFGLQRSVNVWGLGLISDGQVTLAQRHFMLAASADTDPQLFPGRYIAPSGFGTSFTTYTIEVGIRDFQADFNQSGPFDYGPPSYSYNRNEAVNVVYIGFDRSILENENSDNPPQQAADRILITGTQTLGGFSFNGFVGSTGAIANGFGPAPATATFAPAPVTGGAGNDNNLIANSAPSIDYNASAILKLAAFVNGASSPVNLDGSFDFRANAAIENAELVPHATVVAFSNGGYEYYRFTVAPNGGRAVFDIDATSGVDTFIRLLDANGNFVASDDDDEAAPGVLDPGSTNNNDSRLEIQFAFGGTYTLEVGRFLTTGVAAPLLAGSAYTLNVSLERGRLTQRFGVEGGNVDGAGGNDTLFGSAGDDTLNGNTGTDTASFINADTAVTASLAAGLAIGYGEDRLIGIENLVGSNFADSFVGNDAANVLDGGVGADFLAGGAGGDTYVIDNAGDFIIESTGQGADAVLAFIDYALNPSAEIETLIASGATVALMGSSTANTLVGNALGNRLSGLGGSDLLQGFGGDDVLLGGDGTDNLDAGDGRDTLDGGAGADTLQGGAGDDVYVINETGDFIVEAANGGSDVILAFVDYTLAFDAEVEVIAAYGATANLTGSSRANTVVGSELVNRLSGLGGNDILQGQGGNDVLLGGADMDMLDGGAGNDTLDGETGIDRMEGGAGDDVYVVDVAGDLVIELANGGSDIVLAFADYALSADAPIETLAAYGQAQVLTGSSTANALIGNALANTLTGLGGDDLLNGANGSDRMTGGAGADLFAITGVLDGSFDTLTDFTRGQDRILLDDAVFTGLALGALSGSAFTTGAATTTAHRVLYNTTTGVLSWDADGSGAGAAIAFATLTGAPLVSAADFTVF